MIIAADRDVKNQIKRTKIGLPPTHGDPTIYSYFYVSTIPLQFLVYGVYFGALAVLFLVVVLLSVFRDGCCCHGNNELEVATLDNIDRNEET